MNKKILILLLALLSIQTIISAPTFFHGWMRFNIANCKSHFNTTETDSSGSPFSPQASQFTPSNSTGGNDPEQPNYSFADIAGTVPDDVRELVEYVKNVERYKRVGAKMPKGIMLHGPGGTGKTSLARAIAGEANAAFFKASGSEFVEMYVGVGPQRVRELFQSARDAVKSKKYSRAIIFIDEIDAIGCARSSDSNQEYRNTLNELLNQMDGFALEDSIFIIGATNTIEMIDKALLRPGRFDRLVKIDLPNLSDRLEILKHYAKKTKHTIPTSIFQEVAQKTNGCSGAELMSLINEAAIFAARGNKEHVTSEDCLKALNKILEQKRHR